LDTIASLDFTEKWRKNKNLGFLRLSHRPKAKISVVLTWLKTIYLRQDYG